MSERGASTEVLVVGGGVIGCSIAYHLARQGREVLVLDRADLAAEPAASWASAGGVRSQGQDGAEAALARAALARWPLLPAELGAEIGYRQGGHLLVAESEAEAAELVGFVARQQALSFADVRLVDRHEALNIAPGLGAQVLAGSFNPSAGQADPVATTRAFADAARRLGARFWTNTACRDLERAADGVVGARTERGAVRAQQVVLAAGAWSRALALSAGVDLPVRAVALQAVRSTPAAPGALVPVLGALGRALSLRQLPGGAFLVGGGWLADVTPDGQSYRLRAQRQEANWATACAVFPPLAGQQIEWAWGGLQAQVIDDLPLIGGLAGLPGLTLAFGSWFGFALAPAIGQGVANLLAGLPTPELDALRPDRLAQLDSAEAAAFLVAPVEGDAT